MDRRFFFGIAVAFAIVFFGAALAQNLMKHPAPPVDHETLYQVSTIEALMQGVYDGVQPFSEVGRHGDFGIGTFDALDGEMVALDGMYYQVRANGIAYPVPEAMTTPFATVTFFEPDLRITTDVQMNYSVLSTYLSDRMPSQNIVYAVRINGTFPAIKVRSVPMQAPPYLPLTAAVANQTVFVYSGAKGTVVGFFMPQFFSALNVPGYHLHFISEDRKSGGHILDMTTGAGITAELDITPNFAMSLPTRGAFTGADLSQDLSADLAKVER